MSERDLPDGQPWTEAQWERFLRRSDVRSAKFGELLETFRDRPDRDDIIAREMGWDLDAEPPFDVPDPEEVDEDEVEDSARERRSGLESIAAFVRAQAWGRRVREGCLEGEGEEGDEDLAEALGSGFLVAVKIAGGHGMGYEDDSLCGNIVCCRRALEAAQRCIKALESLGARALVPAHTLAALMAEGREVEALVQERIRDLRSRVWWE